MSVKFIASHFEGRRERESHRNHNVRAGVQTATVDTAAKDRESREPANGPENEIPRPRIYIRREYCSLARRRCGWVNEAWMNGLSPCLFSPPAAAGANSSGR